MPSGGIERTRDESTAVDWLTPAEVEERMAEVYAVRLLVTAKAGTVYDLDQVRMRPGMFARGESLLEVQAILYGYG